MRDDPLQALVERAFAATCEAEALIYAAGMERAVKDDAIKAHSHLLSLRNALSAKQRKREAA